MMQRPQYVCLILMMHTFVFTACESKKTARMTHVQVQDTKVQAQDAKATHGAHLRALDLKSLPTKELGVVSLSSTEVKKMEDACKTTRKPTECNPLARRYAMGDGVAPDVNRAYTLWNRMCGDGDMAACTALGVLLERGLGTMRDPDQAKLLHQNACAANIVRGCTNMGVMLLTGSSFAEPRPKDALSMFELGCKGGDARGCANMGFVYERGLHGEKPDVTRALMLYEQSCKKGDMQGCYNLGVLYAPNNRTGHMSDVAKSRSLFKIACKAGHVEACYNFGAAYYSGVGVASKNELFALAWFEYVCMRQNAQGCLSAGLVRMQLKEPPVARAHEMLQRACDMDATKGCEELGLLHLSGGVGKERDHVKTALWLGRACEVHKMKACAGLAGMYARGEGVDKKPARALRLAARACNAGVKEGCVLQQQLGTP